MTPPPQGRRPSNRGYRKPSDRSPHGPKVTPRAKRGTTFRKPQLTPESTSLWTYSSQTYDAGNGEVQGDPSYLGATPSWVVWQILSRYSKPGDTVVDPMCGSGTTIDVCQDLRRNARAFDLVPRRDDIDQADARELPLKNASVDLAFVDPPYSTHIDYSDHEACIGRLDAAAGDAYFKAMFEVLSELKRVTKPGGTIAVYVSDTVSAKGTFVPIGVTLWTMLTQDLKLRGIDMVCVVRKNTKLRSRARQERARTTGPLERGFNWLLIVEKPGSSSRPAASRSTGRAGQGSQRRSTSKRSGRSGGERSAR